MSENEVKNTNIKLKSIIENAQQFDIMSSYPINENGDTVGYKQYFDKNDIEKLTLELLKDVQYAVENKFDYFNNDAELLKYKLLLIIKHFSHFKDDIGDKFEEKIEALEALYKIGLYDLFFESIFDENQVIGVIDHINKVIEKAILNQDIIEKELDKISENKKQATVEDDKPKPKRGRPKKTTVKTEDNKIE